ncbi:hypothetical protein RMATCC62417_18632 [Rhizopus microsporus]|nr:hypothetical protein RMATCC62417_18632 [Rhizopus microsporus]
MKYSKDFDEESSQCPNFPLIMTTPSNIILNISTLNKNNPRESHCKGAYQGVPMECIYIPVCNEDRSQYYHEFYMSDRLTACRNMGAYFNMFEATLSEMNIYYKEIPSERSGLFFTRQHYPMDVYVIIYLKAELMA